MTLSLAPLLYGRPPQGEYYVRVAFGFDPGAQTPDLFSASKVVKFAVP
jgi:hypothetical protein